jgi:hypothetical protein
MFRVNSHKDNYRQHSRYTNNNNNNTIMIIIKLNSLLFMCRVTATRPITDTAQRRYNNNNNRVKQCSNNNYNNNNNSRSNQSTDIITIIRQVKPLCLLLIKYNIIIQSRNSFQLKCSNNSIQLNSIQFFII